MNEVTYADFISRRNAKSRRAGLVIKPRDLHPSLKPFQRRIVTWAASVGRAAIWADTGLGKTRMQLEWARVMGDTSLIVTVLAVVHDQDGWRLKGHAFGPMIRWMTSWAVAIRKPSDMGFDDTGYQLPGLKIIPEVVHVDVESAPDELFAVTIGGVSGRARVRRETMAARVGRAVEIVSAESSEPWLLWCGMNDEAEQLTAAIPGAVNVHGSMSPEDKAKHLLAFAHGEIPALVTKPSIAGMGMNFQVCARMAFVGLSDSYEDYYQCMRRAYRFGQERVVHAHIVLSELEQQIAANVARKEKQANRVVDGMITELRATA